MVQNAKGVISFLSTGYAVLSLETAGLLVSYLLVQHIQKQTHKIQI